MPFLYIGISGQWNKKARNLSYGSYTNTVYILMRNEMKRRNLFWNRKKGQETVITEIQIKDEELMFIIDVS